MSVTRFQTTPKGDPPHYSYIFRKTEPLGGNLNIAACSSLGDMLYLEIKNDKDAMNTYEFQ